MRRPQLKPLLARKKKRTALSKKGVKRERKTRVGGPNLGPDEKGTSSSIEGNEAILASVQLKLRDLGRGNGQKRKKKPPRGGEKLLMILTGFSAERSTTSVEI